MNKPNQFLMHENVLKFTGVGDMVVQATNLNIKVGIVLLYTMG